MNAERRNELREDHARRSTMDRFGRRGRVATVVVAIAWIVLLVATINRWGISP